MGESWGMEGAAPEPEESGVQLKLRQRHWRSQEKQHIIDVLEQESKNKGTSRAVNDSKNK
jgi:hypothetical protein